MKNDSATAGMKIDILSHIKDRNIFSSLPILKQFKDFVSYAKEPIKGLPVNQVIGYVVILYSEDSVLKKQPMPPLDQRQSLAAELVGFKTRKGHYDKTVVDKLFDLNDEKIFAMSFEYLMFQKSAEWQLLIATETLRLSCLKDMMKPTKSTNDLMNKNKLKNTVKEYNDDINVQMKEIFEDHKKLMDVGKEKLWGDTIETII